MCINRVCESPLAVLFKRGAVPAVPNNTMVINRPNAQWKRAEASERLGGARMLHAAQQETITPNYLTNRLWLPRFVDNHVHDALAQHTCRIVCALLPSVAG